MGEEPFAVDAVNRRGRRTKTSVRMAPLASAAAEVIGVIVMMDAGDAAES